MAKIIKMTGPPLSKVMAEISNSNMIMIKQGMINSTNKMQKNAIERSPIKSGQFVKDLQIGNHKLTKTESSATIGIVQNSRSWPYAAKVERKHKIFRRLEGSSINSFKDSLGSSINNFWQKKRVK